MLSDQTALFFYFFFKRNIAKQLPLETQVILDTVLLGLCAHYTKSGSTAISRKTIFGQLYSHIAESFTKLFVITKTIMKLLYHNHVQTQLSEHHNNFSISYAAIMLSTKSIRTFTGHNYYLCRSNTGLQQLPAAITEKISTLSIWIISITSHYLNYLNNI